jgi:putative SOS response-associated peptidase YedK
MCGRFTLTQSPELVAELFELEDLPQFVAGFNIAPTQPVPVIRLAEARSSKLAQRHFDFLYWGLIPSWAKDPSMGARMINARSETVTEKPSFRTAFKRRRCLIVADGFYEWQKVGSKKQPYYFHLDDHRPFGFAGLWERWHSPAGDEIESCTILTTAANELMRPIHDRMPVILPPQLQAQWLDPTQDGTKLLPLLQPYPEAEMHSYPVSTAVNSPKHDSPDCILPLEAAPQKSDKTQEQAPVQNSR